MFRYEKDNCHRWQLQPPSMVAFAQPPQIPHQHHRQRQPCFSADRANG